MSLLQLKNIGKIYVSEGNVAVGVRGVNLSFDLGEFVAITGKSGSGKSTILNVISGMDSYEEGEYFVEGKPTSHYTQADWEYFREKYISFIFQDYNIIESFTVLQNVELALLNIISDFKERRNKAIELIKKVGLEKQINSKGSKLSGGQKQRTVIARALAKDSKIILADEPTGNLDSESGKEIIKLLKEVSKDKLVIIVTHNFDEVAPFATRQIRVFDSNIEFDHQIGEQNIINEEILDPVVNRNNFSKSFKLGITRFFAMPKLTIYIVALMTLAVIALTFICSNISSSMSELQNKNIFTHYDGRLIITKKDNTPMTDFDYQKVTDSTNPNSIVKMDYYFDNQMSVNFSNYYTYFKISYLRDEMKLSLGKMPQNAKEVILEVPIGFPDGNKLLTEDNLPYEINIGQDKYYITGVKYFIDNTKESFIYFTKDDYDTIVVTEITSRLKKWSASYTVNNNTTTSSCLFVLDDSLSNNSFTFYDNNIEKLNKLNQLDEVKDFQVTISFDPYGLFYNNYVYYDSYEVINNITLTFDFNNYQFINCYKTSLCDKYHSKYKDQSIVFVSKDIYTEIINNQIISNSYPQFSAFYDNDLEASNQISKLDELGYFAYLSNTTKSLSAEELLVLYVTGGISLVAWILYAIFLAFLVYLCTHKALTSTKPDIAIMRSMGISTKLIKQSIIIQNAIAIIFAIVINIIFYTIIYLVPKTNNFVRFLHFKDYLLILLMIIFIYYRLTKSYIKLMFDTSVKKTLKGGIKG